MSRMTKMKSKIQRTNGSAESMNPASALNNIIDKFADKGGQDRLRTPVKPVSSAFSSKALYSDYVRGKTPTKIRNYARMAPSGRGNMPMVSDRLEFEQAKSTAPFRKIIDRIVREGKRDVVKESLGRFAGKSKKEVA